MPWQFSNLYAALSADVLDAKYMGEGVIGGVDSHHLAFRNADTDWQLWVEMDRTQTPLRASWSSPARR